MKVKKMCLFLLSIISLSNAEIIEDMLLISNKNCLIEIKNNTVNEKGKCISNKKEMIDLFNENLEITDMVDLKSKKILEKNVYQETQEKIVIIDLKKKINNTIFSLLMKYQPLTINNESFLLLNYYEDIRMDEKTPRKDVLTMIRYNEKIYKEKLEKIMKFKKKYFINNNEKFDKF